MKQSIIGLLMAVLAIVSASLSHAAEKKNPPANPPAIPIIIYEEDECPKTYSLTGFIEISATVTDGSISFDLPFEGYPMTVEIVGEGMTRGYWSGTLLNSLHPEMPFDGTVGDYRLTLTTADNSTYTGYFTLE